MVKTANKNKAEVLPSILNVFISHRLFEGFFIFTLVCSVYLMLSLWTFSLGSGALVHNAGGIAGAFLSHGFFSIFGYAAYLWPFILSYGAFSLLKPSTSVHEKISIIAIKILGLMCISLSFCSLASLMGLSFSQILPKSGGGTIGLFMAHALYDSFDMVGALILLAGLGLIGLTLVTHISWLNSIEFIGESFSNILTALMRFNRVFGVLTSFFKNNRVIVQAWLEKRKVLNIEKIKSKALLKKEKGKENVKTSISSAFKKVPKEMTEILEVSIEDSYLKDDFFGTPPAVPAKVKVNERYQKENKQTLFKSKGNKGLPSLSLLSQPQESLIKRASHEELEQQSRDVEQRLLDFGVDVKVVAVHPGPVITRFELQLAAGLKVSKITALGKDLARSLSVTGVRVVEVIPGKSVIGIELPNTHRDMVTLSEVLSTDIYAKSKSPLSLALGVDIGGTPMIVDLSKMPHLLVAGTTGSGKSVGINAMLLSLLFKSTPDEVRLIMVDPKMLELSVYDGIPHLLTPVVTDMKDAARALRWCVMEMERRYRLMSALGVRNLEGFNTKVKEAAKRGEPIKDPLWQGLEVHNAPELVSLPSIVVVIDELADMMMVVGKKVEQLIARIAQKARAAGIHLILATQRPSVDVLTGLIKSNIPTRIAFQVSSKIDSRTILDQGGADQLLGHGDMLYLAPGSGAPIRVHGAFVDDNEVHRIASAWRELGEPDYIDDITNAPSEGADDFNIDGNADGKEEVDALYDEAIEFITQARKASISSIQRRFKIGYNRAARLVEEMERTGVVGPMEGGSREVLAPAPPPRQVDV